MQRSEEGRKRRTADRGTTTISGLALLLLGLPAAQYGALGLAFELPSFPWAYLLVWLGGPLGLVGIGWMGERRSGAAGVLLALWVAALCFAAAFMALLPWTRVLFDHGPG